MADNNPNIILDGDVSPLRKSMREAAEELKRFGKEGESALGKMTGPLGALQEKFIAVGAILAGGKVFQEAVQQTKEWTEQSVDLAAALGLSATAAGDLKAALAEENVGASEFMDAAQKLANNLRTDEEALNAVGLATRDTAGNLRPLNEMTLDAIALTHEYRAGTDRAVAAQVLFGRGFQISGDLAKVNSQLLEENIDRQRRLGAVVTNETVAAFEEYDASSKNVDATMRAIGQTVGNIVMPILADLGNWFSSVGPTAIGTIKLALGGLAAAFHAITTGVTVLWETINAMVVSVAEPIRALGLSIGRALKGDFDGAKSALAGIGDVQKNAWDNAFNQIAAKAQSTHDRIAALFSSGTPVATPEVGGRTAEGLLEKPKAPGGAAKTGEKSEMSYYEALLAKKKEAFSQENALRDYSKAQELAYWESILNFATLSANDRLAVERKVSALTVDVRKQEAQQKQDLDAESTRSAEALALARIDAQQAAVDGLLAAEKITQTAALAQEREFEQQRYGIKRQALQDKLALYESDPELNPVEMARLKNQLLELEQQYQLKKNQLNGKYLQIQKLEATKANKIWTDLGESFSSLWDKGIQSMMNGTLTWRNAVKAIGTELVGWFAKSVVGAMLKNWIAGKAAEFAVSMGWISKEKALSLGFMSEELAAKQTTAATSTAITGAQAMTEVGNKGASAAAGAADAVSSIPYVGPILAAAAFAATLAMVLGARSNIKSASKGYSIPKGLNPMTQLHEEEMVLPSEHANVIRSLAEGKGGVGGMASVTVNALDARSFKRYLADNARSLAPGLRELDRLMLGKKR